jgi:hypothetical protein
VTKCAVAALTRPIAPLQLKWNPDLIVHDKDGQIYSVRYDAVNAKLEVSRRAPQTVLNDQ